MINNNQHNLKPNYAWMLTDGRFFVISATGRPGMALNNYERATEINPNYSLAFLKIGNNFIKVNANTSLDAYKKIIEIDFECFVNNYRCF